MAKVITDFQHLTLDDIIEWCQDNKQVEWLKEEAQKKFERKIYPKVETISKNGKKSWKLDKTKPYIITVVEWRKHLFTFSAIHTLKNG